MIKNKLNFQLLLSDFDADGIRDFTLSSHQNKLIISAEDTDWDNDGTPNLIDSTLGDFDLNINISPVSIDNHFQSMSSQAKVQAQLEKDFKLIQFDRNHELLVLDVFTKVIKKLGKEKFNIRFLSASSSQMKKGNNSFFSYSKLTKVLEYDPKHLYEFIKREEKKRFPGVEFPLLIRSYVIPIILHSLLHEIGHATKTDQKEWSLKNDWAWIETEYIGKYLNSFREEVKEIKTYKENSQLNLFLEECNLKEKNQEIILIRNTIVKNEAKQVNIINQSLESIFEKLSPQGNPYPSPFPLKTK